MDIVDDFISNQKKILRSERKFCQKKRELVGDVRGFFGKILKTFVPKYGGTVVTFEIRGYQEHVKTLKLGNIIETR